MEFFNRRLPKRAVARKASYEPESRPLLSNDSLFDLFERLKRVMDVMPYGHRSHETAAAVWIVAREVQAIKEQLDDLKKQPAPEPPKKTKKRKC